MVKRTDKGFTLLELLVVLAIVATLLTLALPRYSQSVDVAKGRILAENLRVTRGAIDKFYADVQRYPQSLQELVDRRYLKSLPMDPILERDDAWVTTSPPPDQGGGLVDLRSSAAGSNVDGVPYSEL